MDLSFAEEFGPTAFTMKARAEGMRDFGPCLKSSKCVECFTRN